MSELKKGVDITQGDLDEEQIVAYLLAHPDFFIRHGRKIEHLAIAHPVRGAISLVEWKLARQREKIETLSAEMAQLVAEASANELLISRLLTLLSALSQAQSLDDFLQHLQRWARTLGLTGAYLRLFNDKWSLGSPSRFSHMALSQGDFELLRIQRLRQANHYLGKLNGSELLMLLPQDAQGAGSVALSLLGESADLGVLIFTSRDSEHYQEGMGTTLLHHLAILLPSLLTRWVQRQ